MISGTKSLSNMAVMPSRPPSASETTANESFLSVPVANEALIPLKAMKLETPRISVKDNTANSLGATPVRYCELLGVLEISLCAAVWCLTGLSLRTTWIGIA